MSPGHVFICSTEGASTRSCLAGGHTGPDEGKKWQKRHWCPSSHPWALPPELLQYLQEANELFHDLANPFSLPVYTVDTNHHSQIDLAAAPINSLKTETNGPAGPQASHSASSDMPDSASRRMRPAEEEFKVPTCAWVQALISHVVFRFHSCLSNFDVKIKDPFVSIFCLSQTSNM